MHQSNSQAPDLVIEAIPQPDELRRMLEKTIQQTALLRSLLRVAKRKESLIPQVAARQAVGHG